MSHNPPGGLEGAGITSSFLPNIKLYGLVLHVWLLACQWDRKESKTSLVSKTPDVQVYCFASKTLFWKAEAKCHLFSFSLHSFPDALKSLHAWKCHHDYLNYYCHLWEVTYHLANVFHRVITLINLLTSIFRVGNRNSEGAGLGWVMFDEGGNSGTLGFSWDLQCGTLNRHGSPGGPKDRNWAAAKRWGPGGNNKSTRIKLYPLHDSALVQPSAKY